MLPFSAPQKRGASFLICLGTTLGWAACGPALDPGADARYLLDETKRLELEVAYEPGAEPYGGTYQGLKTWDITRENLTAIYDTRSRSVEVYVPDSTSLMSELPPQDRAVWSANDLRTIEGQYRRNKSDGTTGRVFVVFVNGYFLDETIGKPATNVMAVSIPDTTVIVVFKQVIQSASASHSGLALRWLEQSTLVHELGHVVGLVDHGVPKQSPLHREFTSEASAAETHGAHCGNPDCVMYWAHEGLASLYNMTDRASTSGSYTLFGAECLDDLRSF